MGPLLIGAISLGSGNLRIYHIELRFSGNMGLLNLVARVWGQLSWHELTFKEKSITVFIIFDVIVVSPFVILDLLDNFGLI